MCGFYYMAREHLRACLTPCRHIFGGTASPNISCRRSREGRHDDTDPLVLHGVLPRAGEVVDGCQTFHKAEAIQRLPAEPVLHAETGNVSAVARLDRVLHVIPSGLLVHVHGRLLPVHVGRPLDSHWNHVRLERRRAVAGIPLWRQVAVPRAIAQRTCRRTSHVRRCRRTAHVSTTRTAPRGHRLTRGRMVCSRRPLVRPGGRAAGSVCARLLAHRIFVWLLRPPLASWGCPYTNNTELSSILKNQPLCPPKTNPSRST